MNGGEAFTNGVDLGVVLHGVWNGGRADNMFVEKCVRFLSMW